MPFLMSLLDAWSVCTLTNNGCRPAVLLMPGRDASGSPLLGMPSCSPGSTGTLLLEVEVQCHASGARLWLLTLTMSVVVGIRCGSTPRGRHVLSRAGYLLPSAQSVFVARLMDWAQAASQRCAMRGKCVPNVVAPRCRCKLRRVIVATSVRFVVA